MSPSTVGWLFAVLGAFGFSFKAILVKLAYRYGVDAETLLALRMVFALPFFVVMGLWAGRLPGAQKMTGRLWAWMIGLGFLGYYLSSYLDFLGLQYISAGLERLILFLYPTIVIVLSAVFLAKPLTARTGLALLLCYLGIGLAVGHDLNAHGDSQQVVWGSVLVFGSAVSYALYLLGNGVIVSQLGAMRVTALATSVACVLCIGQFFVLRPAVDLIQPWQVYVLSGLMAIVSTVAPVWLVSEAIRRLGAGPVSLTGTLGPVATIALAWLLLDESFGPAQAVGTALVVSGVLVMAPRPRKASSRAPE